MTKSERILNPITLDVYQKIIHEGDLPLTPAQVDDIVLAAWRMATGSPIGYALTSSKIIQEFYDQHINVIKQLYPKYKQILIDGGLPYFDVIGKDQKEEAKAMDEEEKEQKAGGTIRFLVTLGRDNFAELQKIKQRSGRSISSIVAGYVDEGLHPTNRGRK